MKLLQKQKEGKKRMKMIGKIYLYNRKKGFILIITFWMLGNVELPQKAFYDFMDKSKSS